MAKRPDMPRSLRLAIYRRDGFACRHCGWKVDEPEGYRGIKPITVLIGTKTVRKLVKPSFTDAPDIYREDIKHIYRSLEIDHIRPLSKGGAFRDPANLQALCSPCNNLKGVRI